MSTLLAMVLATSVSASPTCAKSLLKLYHAFRNWSASERHIAYDFEEHNFHTVSKQGVTVKVSIVAAFGPEVGQREVRGYEQMESCTMNGMSGRILFKREVK